MLCHYIVNMRRLFNFKLHQSITNYRLRRSKLFLKIQHNSTLPIVKKQRDGLTGLKGVNYEKPILCGTKFELDIPQYDEIHEPVQPCHPFYTYHLQTFNKERYRYSTLPIHIGPFHIDWNIQIVTNVLRCPIKMAGTRNLIIPSELEFLKGYIFRCAVYETCFNHRFNDLYMHITVHGSHIEPNTTQRVPGFHVDGFQGHKFRNSKHEIEHSYLWTSNHGTEFCAQPFFIEHIDDSKYNVLLDMEKQARTENIYSLMPQNIYIFDPYMVHRSPIIRERTNRLLIRLTCEYQKLLDPNDTINPGLIFNAPYKYDIRNSLGECPTNCDAKMYGFDKP